ncbi:MAG: hypothetical protein CMJ31_06225 [Phycisphaerae bacterium]|nr:hypothetical protein [Phycisphaerae bacterium]
MLRVIGWRLAQAPLIIFAIYTITLALAWAAPGNPLENPEGRRPPPEVAAQMRAQYELDSFGSFYLSYLDRASGLRWTRARLSGSTVDGPVFDLGPSLQYTDWSVNEIIAGSLPASIALGLSAIVLACVIGVGAGVVGACKPGSLADFASLGVALIGVSLPAFVTGSVLLLVFGVWLGVAPVAEWGTPRAMVLPALTLSLPFAAYIARLTRFGMIEALGSDYVRTARAKGLSERSVVLRHALRNALLPVVSYLGPATAFALTGSFVVERIFRVPGVGQHFVNAVQNKDLFLIMGVVLVFSTLLIMMNLIVDVLYGFVDPRTRNAST